MRASDHIDQDTELAGERDERTRELLVELDRFRRAHGLSRADAIFDAVRWYVRWAEVLPVEDPAAEEIDP